MLTLNVADSMLGREFWNKILDKLPFKPGCQLVLSHNALKLVLYESLQHEGFRSQREQVSATYMPVNLLAALHSAQADSIEDEEVLIERDYTSGVDDELPALLRNLPKSFRTLTFGQTF